MIYLLEFVDWVCKMNLINKCLLVSSYNRVLGLNITVNEKWDYELRQLLAQIMHFLLLCT